jgi:hypothetical protein
MPPRLALPLFALAALLAVPAAARAADVVRPSSVSQATVVPAGGARTLALRCPTAAVALNAAVTRHGSGVSLRRSVPGADAGSWRFRLANASGARRRAAAVLRCVRLEVPAGISGVHLNVSTRRRPAVAIPAGGTADVGVRCHRGWGATGYALQPGADAGDIRIAAAVPSASGWSFTLENTGAALADTNLSVRCLKRDVSGRRAGAATTLRFVLARPTFENRVRSGAGGFSHTCARRQFAVATGLSLDPDDDIVMRGSFPSAGDTGVWSFRHSGAAESVESSLVCLTRGARFG